MKLSKEDVAQQILCEKHFNINNNEHIYFATINIALIKYWGKKDENLNLAMTPSLSISSTTLGTKMQIAIAEVDELTINGQQQQQDVMNKTFGFINLWRKALCFKQCMKITSYNNIPTASGLASSASSFACLTKALSGFFSLDLSPSEQSTLARLGSGSACRSVFENSRFAVWNGDFAVPFDFVGKAKQITDNMKLIVLILDDRKKTISSRDAMTQTKQSWLAGNNMEYKYWLEQTRKDFIAVQNSTSWNEFGEIVERNSLLMHKAIQKAGINYFSSHTITTMQFIKFCRHAGKNIYATIDAGANVKILLQKQDEFWLKQQIQDTLIQSKICKRMLDF